MIVIKYARIPTAMMESPIPEGIPYSMGDDGQKTLREFVFQHLTWDLEDDTTLFRLACKQGKSGRYIRGTDEQDMMDWNGFLAPHGFGEDTWLTHEEAMQLAPQQEEI